MLRSCPSIHHLLLLHQYDGPVKVPPADAVLVEIVVDGKKLRCLQQEVRRPAPLLIWCLLLCLFLLCHLICLLYPKKLYFLIPIAFAALPFFLLRTATAPDGVPIDILVPIGDVVVLLRILIGSVYMLYRRCGPLISALLIVLIPRLFLLQYTCPVSLPFFCCLELGLL